MKDNDWENIAEATLASVGVVQGLFVRFLDENNGDRDIALALTQITWEGIMHSAQKIEE